MKLYEPFSLTLGLLYLLVLAFSGTLFTTLYSQAQRDCHQRNAEMYEAGKQGPAAPCL